MKKNIPIIPNSHHAAQNGATSRCQYIRNKYLNLINLAQMKKNIFLTLMLSCFLTLNLFCQEQQNILKNGKTLPNIQWEDKTHVKITPIPESLQSASVDEQESWTIKALDFLLGELIGTGLEKIISELTTSLVGNVFAVLKVVYDEIEVVGGSATSNVNFLQNGNSITTDLVANTNYILLYTFDNRGSMYYIPNEIKLEKAKTSVAGVILSWEEIKIIKLLEENEESELLDSGHLSLIYALKSAFSISTPGTYRLGGHKIEVLNDTHPPRIIGEEIDYNIDGKIKLIVSENLNNSSVNSESINITGTLSGKKELLISINENIISITPKTNFYPNEEVSVLLTSGITDLANNTLIPYQTIYSINGLTAPTITASTGTYSDKIQISWSEVAEAMGYQLYRNTSNNSATATYIGPFSKTNRVRVDEDVEPNTTYYYWVVAYSNATGEYIYSAFSNSDTGWSTGTRDISFSDYRINDGNYIGGEGDGDGKAESGELIELDIELYNSGNTNAQDVRATLSTNDPDIEIIKDDLSWGRINPDSKEWDSDSEFRISFNCPTKDVTFTLDITSSSTEEKWSNTITIPIYKIPTVYIPDANFEQALIDEGIDTDGIINQKILISDAESVDDDLRLENRNISSLTGIGAFKNIQRLYCEGNQITELDISNNKDLYYLNCEGNLLTELDISKNTNLTKIRCASNQIEILDVRNNTKLDYLSCSGNPITSLDVSNNTVLTLLNCNNTNLSTLNLRNNLKLIDLGCDGNKLENLDISKNTKLTNLECDDNLLTSLDLSQNSSLIELWCRRNQLTDIIFSQNSSLTILECESNKLTNLDISKNSALIEVDCSLNELISLDASNNHNLTDLICESNQLFYLDMRNGIAPDDIDLRAEFNNLTCINVDDENHPNLDSWDVDDGVVFSENCPKDLDGDGVLDNVDLCPNTPTGETVNSQGCSENQLDNDSDGVMNNLDDCPNTTAGETVNSEGCSESQIDDDSDGVMNNLDDCPGTPMGETVNSEGCSASQLGDDDYDDDGVMNNLDNCPNTPTGETVNSQGCSESQLDDDSDGVMNNLDDCPGTPTGETVNSEGCSASQTEDKTLTVSKSSISLGSTSNSSSTFTISSNTTWNISANQSWISVSPSSGSNNGTVTIKATSENTSTSNRSGSFIITGDGVSSKTVSVTQLGNTNPSANSDSLALVSLYNSCDGSNWTNNTNWLNGPIKSWFGVTVEYGRVVALKLYNNNLSGTIPIQIGDLSELQVLWLNYNGTIVGEVPTEIGNLLKLTDLRLSGNQFDGEIPNSIWNLTNLTSLNLQQNRLQGELSPNVQNLTKLTQFLVNNNDLSGAIPTNLTTIVGLRTVDARWNSFDELPLITSLNTIQNGNINLLKFSDNNLTFEDFEKNQSIIDESYFNYSPQKKIGETKSEYIGQGESYTLNIECGGQNNLYQWFKNGTKINEPNTSVLYTIPSFSKSDEGNYTCKITNTVVKGLTIETNTITLSLKEEIARFLDIQKNFMDLGNASNSSETISITSNTTWNINETQSWISVSTTSGINYGTVTVKATSANTSTSSRTGTVTITGDGVASKTITVTQEGTPVAKTLTVSSSSIALASASNSSSTFSINSNTSWTISANQSWISITPTSGNNNGAITIQATSENSSNSSRSTNITISSSGISKIINVIQEGTIVDIATKELVWDDGFEYYSSNTFPNNWIADANATDISTNHIDYSISKNGITSLKLFGQIGACWGALAYRSISITPPYYISFDVRNGSEELSGCHPDRASIALRKGTSWSNPARALLDFKNDGKMYTDGNIEIGTYKTNEWYNIKIKYELSINNKMSITYWRNEELLANIYSPRINEESNLDNLQLAVQEGSAWFDNVAIYKPIAVSSKKNELINNSIKIFPNPANDILNIQFLSIQKNYEIEFYNNLGQQILHKESSNRLEELDLSEFISGIYYLKIYNNDFSKTEKIIIR